MARPYSNDLRERVAAAVGGGRGCPEIARRRVRWKTYQGRGDPRRLVFIDETWAKTNMTPIRG